MMMEIKDNNQLVFQNALLTARVLYNIPTIFYLIRQRSRKGIIFLFQVNGE